MAKRIFFIHQKFPYGGAEKVTIDVANYLSYAGWDAAVVAQEMCSEYFPDNVQMNFCLKVIPPQMISKGERNRWVTDLINKEKIDVIVCKDEWTIDIGYIKENTSAKVIFHLHAAPFWEEITRYNQIANAYEKRLNFLLKWKFALTKKKYKREVSHSVHNYYSDLLRKIDGMVTLCYGYKDIINSDTNSLFNSKIFPIYNACMPVLDLGVKQKKEIIYVGHLTFTPKKIDRLLRIWEMCCKQIPDWTLRIIGDGPDKKTLEKLSAQLQLTNISFEGWKKDVSPFYASATIICMTSDFEGWPLALADGQCYGVIPIAFDVCAGIHEMLSPNGVNGILIDDINEKQYASELVRLAKDVDLQQKMRENVIKKSKAYSWDNMGKSWLKMLATI